MNIDRNVKLMMFRLDDMIFSQSFSDQEAATGHTHHHTPMAMIESVSDDSLHQLSASWRDHRNQPMTLKDLSGKAVIVTMIYANCQTACPVLVEDVKRLYHGLDDAQQADTRVLVVSFDAERDTPEALHRYAIDMGADRQIGRASCRERV